MRRRKSRKKDYILMADEKLQKLENVSVEDDDEEEEEKWVKYYSNNHQILLVGEGDFSFSLSLAHSFASAFNIVATSLDSRDEVQKKYKKALSNLDELQKLGASVIHGVDATKMKYNPLLKMRRFDRIIFNFPHAGFHGKEDNLSLIKKHQDLVYGFFLNARHMIRSNGEIHVNHKTTTPLSDWNIVILATQSLLSLIGCADFNKEDFPGYNNKRGDGMRSDEPFPLGECSTFKFALCPEALKKNHPKIRHGNANDHAFNMGCSTEQRNVSPIHISTGISCSSYEYPYGSVHGDSSWQPRNVGFGYGYLERNGVRNIPSSVNLDLEICSPPPFIASPSKWADHYNSTTLLDPVLLSCGGRARNEASQPHHVFNGRSRFLEEEISVGRTGQSANCWLQRIRCEHEYINEAYIGGGRWNHEMMMSSMYIEPESDHVTVL